MPASELAASDVVIDSPGDVIWIDPPPAEEATHFDILLAAPGAEGSEGRGFATAAGAQTTTEVVTVHELENGERMWVVAHSEPVDPEMRVKIDEVRATIIEIGGPLMDEQRKSEGPNDFRGMAAGHQDDGTRFYIDLNLP